MKVNLNEEEKRLVGFEITTAALMAAFVVMGVKEIIDGSLCAVILSPIAALIGCLLMDDVQSIIRGARDRNEREKRYGRR